MKYLKVLLIICIASHLHVYAQKPDTRPDNTYGEGGTKTTTSTKLKDGGSETKTTIKDKDGNVKEEKTITINNSKEEIETTDYYDNNGKKKRHTQTQKDANGNTIYQLDENYKDGVITSGELTDNTTGKNEKKKYNPNTEKYEPVNEGQSTPYDFKLPDFSNDVITAVSLIYEDSYNRFFTYGINVAYIHALNPNIGITGDAGIYSGSDNGINYTKIQVLGGINLLPHPHGNNRVLFSPHLLAGIVTIHSKYKMASYSSSSSAFSMAAGTDVAIGLNNRAAIAVRADYNPAFPSGGVAHNFRLSTGLVLRLGEK